MKVEIAKENERGGILAKDAPPFYLTNLLNIVEKNNAEI